MNASTTATPHAAPAAVAERAPTAVPWVLYPILASSLSILIGLIWDISWHRTIGRDTFWSPPHVLEQLAAVVTGLTCGWLVLHTTFRGTAAEKAATVRFWGFRGPLGAWVCIWGTIMMITSAPFDDWWHNAYGLDVEIISPPHMVLASGMIGIQIGAMLLAVAAQNRVSPRDASRLGVLYALSAGILIGMAATVIMEDASMPNEMHRPLFYQMTAVVVPVFLLAAARASRLRWPATTAALIYMAVELGMIWTLQLFPATARLAPIYNPVTNMVPPPFPLLLVFPALGLDLLLRRIGHRSDWLLAPAAGLVFVALMLAVHWYWSGFLLSPAARNFVFAADQWDYSVRLGPWRYEYWEPVSRTALLQGLALAALLATVSARVGLWWGKGMARVQR
jgi:hypothetical protein